MMLPTVECYFTLLRRTLVLNNFIDLSTPVIIINSQQLAEMIGIKFVRSHCKLIK